MNHCPELALGTGRGLLFLWPLDSERGYIQRATMLAGYWSTPNKSYDFVNVGRCVYPDMYFKDSSSVIYL